MKKSPEQLTQLAKPSGQDDGRKLELLAFLAALCFILSSIEYMIPKPLPFMRLGLANLPLLLAVSLLPWRSYLMLALLKVLGMGLVSGTLFSYIALFSFSGTMVSALTMRALYWLLRDRVSYIGLSVMGALLSNISQIALAWVFVFGQLALLTAPLFLSMGLIASILLGVFAESFTRRSQFWQQLRSGLLVTHVTIDNSAQPEIKKVNIKPLTRQQKFDAAVNKQILAIAGVVFIALFLIFARDIRIQLTIFILCFITVYLTGKKIAPVITTVTMLGIIIANLLVPTGKVLYTLFYLPITEISLRDGISKALIFEVLLFVSKISIRRGLNFPGKIGNLISTAFLYYGGLMHYKHKWTFKGLITHLDHFLFFLVRTR